MFEHLKEVFFYALPLSGGMIILGYAQVMCLRTSANQLLLGMHESVIKSLLRQDILFYDRGDAEKLNASIDDKFQSLISGVQDHAGKLFFSVGAVLGGILVSALISPTFTLGLLLSVMTLISLERLLSACLFQKVGEGVRLEQ